MHRSTFVPVPIARRRITGVSLSSSGSQSSLATSLRSRVDLQT